MRKSSYVNILFSYCVGIAGAQRCSKCARLVHSRTGDAGAHRKCRCAQVMQVRTGGAGAHR